MTFNHLMIFGGELADLKQQKSENQLIFKIIIQINFCLIKINYICVLLIIITIYNAHRNSKIFQ